MCYFYVPQVNNYLTSADPSWTPGPEGVAESLGSSVIFQKSYFKGTPWYIYIFFWSLFFLVAVNLLICSVTWILIWYDSSPSNENSCKTLRKCSNPRIPVTRANMADFLKYSTSELQCSICCELFIQPRIINCGHIMCLFCLTEWKKEQKNCPLCRCLITSQCRCPNIDNIIDGIVRSFPDSLKKERSNAISSRDSCDPTISKINPNKDNQRLNLSWYPKCPLRNILAHPNGQHILAQFQQGANRIDENRLPTNLSERINVTRHIYTSLFNRPEYLNDFEVHV